MSATEAAIAQIPVPYFFARPADEPPWSGVVVVMEGGGLTVQLLRLCERLARAGHATVAPDLFHRLGGSDRDKALAGRWFSNLDDDAALEDLTASAGALRALGATAVGMTGFCMGGRLTYLAATSGLELQAAVPFYGGGIAQILAEPKCPLLAFFGGDDQYIPVDDIAAVQRHHPDDVVVYPDAGHGFMRDGTDSYHAVAATDAWARMLDFLGEHLATGV